MISREEKLKQLQQARTPKPKKEKKPIPKMSKKKAAAVKAEKAERGNEDTFLVKWFRARMKLMQGECAECGMKTETKIYQYAIMHICHILAKRLTVCPSLELHPMNWIELCHHHHDVLDKSNWDEIQTWGCWPLILERMVMMWPDTPQEERRHFPEIVEKEYLKLIQLPF